MAEAEKHSFEAEIQQVLDIVINSLYTDKEVFLRELVSNAADACEKMRFLQVAGKPIQKPELELKIKVTTDDKEKTITIEDTGIGMTHDELVENLGRIAHSGSKAFIKQMAEQQEKADTSLIGQFGVGFYSAFMVGKKVTVYTRSGSQDDKGWIWISDGTGTYTIEEAGETGVERGTKIIIELKKEEERYSFAASVEDIIKRYSNFVTFPIELNGKQINQVQAIWTRNKNEIKEEDYQEFYKYIAHDQEPPLFRLHFSTDAPLSIQALVFVPTKNFEIPGMNRAESEVHLHCKKVLIQARAKGLLPEWLRFLRGVVDSEDLPLNISRESMQDSALMMKLNQVLTRRIIKFLDEQAKKDPEKYITFFTEFGRFIKEGIVSDIGHKEDLGKLLRYETSALEAGQTASLADYISRMGPDQKEIYYLVAPSREAVLSSPYYEPFASKKYEVLFLYDPWDDFVMEHLHEMDGKKLTSAEKAEIEADPSSSTEKLSDEQVIDLTSWMKKTLGPNVNEVKGSRRLVDSPAVVVDTDKFMTASMRQMMKSLQKDSQEGRQDLEINPAHPLIIGLNTIRKEKPDLAKKMTEQIVDSARAASGLMDDPRIMARRMNELMLELLKTGKPS